MFPEPVDRENRPQFVEIEAADELAKGQNFYDQEPFKSALDKTASETETDPAKLRSILTALGRKILPDAANIPSTEDITKIMMYPKYQPNFERSYFKFMSDNVDKYRKAVAAMAEHLKPFPFWYEYMRNFETAYYNQDGSMKETLPHYIPQKSYAKWLSQKPKTIGPGVTFGIEEVFPQDFATESPAVSPKPATAAGKKPGHHVYRIQKQMK